MDAMERGGALLALSCVAGLAFMALSPQALAASVDVRERTARKACLSGDFAKGIEILADLFVRTEDTTMIFNQGRCFEQNRRYEDAIARFQEYLRASPKLSAGDKAAAKRHIADCQELLDKQSAKPVTAPRTPEPEPVVVPPPPTPVPVPVPEPVVAQQEVPAKQPSTVGGGLRTAGIITASAGGTALIAGIALNLKVNSLAREMEDNPGAWSTDKESSRKTYQRVGWVAYGAGAACVVTGAVLYLLGRPSGSESKSSAALLPTFSASHVGFSLSGAY
jgi:hypothetical protein